MADQAVFHAHKSQLAVCAVQCKCSAATAMSFNNQIGAKFSAGTMDTDGSGEINWLPAFNSAPIVFATVMSGVGSRSSSFGAVQLTGITVSNCYVVIGPTPASNITLGMIMIGECKL